MNSIKIFFGITLMMFLVTVANAQSIGGAANATKNGTTVASTCFGDCGGSSQLMFVAKSSKARGNSVYSAVCTENSLCGNLGTVGRVYVNGMLVREFDFTYVGSGVTFTASSGEVILVEAMAAENDPNASCLSQGSFAFKLVQK